MDPDQTLGLHCLSVRASDILVDNKNIHFVIMR